MVIDLRYQIVTTVIIFLTLGIGILIGSSMVGQEGVIKEQKRLINYLESDFSQLRKNNRQFKEKIQNLQQKLKKNNEFQQKIFPLVIQNRIDGNKVLVVYNDKMKQKTNKLKQILEMAGSEKTTIKKFNYLKSDINLDLYDYLICLENDKLEIKKEFQDTFKKITYLPEDIFQSRRKVMTYILKLSGDLSNLNSDFSVNGSVQVE